MRKLIMVLFLLASVYANAQWYRAGSRAGNNMARYAHNMKIITMQQNARYESYKNNISYGSHKFSEEKDNVSFWDKQQMFSLGITIGCIYGGYKNHIYYGLETIIGGALIGLTLSNSDDEYGVTTGFQFGYYIPLCKFGKDDYRHGWNHALLISPLIEFNKIMVIDGEHMHHESGHNCKWWIDKSYAKEGKTGFGAAIMYRFGNGIITAKITTNSAGLTLGFGV